MGFSISRQSRSSFGRRWAHSTTRHSSLGYPEYKRMNIPYASQICVASPYARANIHGFGRGTSISPFISFHTLYLANQFLQQRAMLLSLPETIFQLSVSHSQTCQWLFDFISLRTLSFAGKVARHLVAWGSAANVLTNGPNGTSWECVFCRHGLDAWVGTRCKGKEELPQGYP